MSPEQVRLRALYDRLWPGLVAKLSGFPKTREVSFPLLVDVDATNYFRTSSRLVVVGQQTGGWVGFSAQVTEADAFERCLQGYAKFALGRNPGGASFLGTPFWTASHELYRRIEPSGPEGGFVWTDLLRVDEHYGRPSPDVEGAVLGSFNVFGEEMSILRPAAVVFFTGPDYDEVLRRTLPGVEFSGVSGNHADAILRLKHLALPPLSFRTYHPKYLRLSGRWGLIAALAEQIRRANVG